MVIHGGCRDTDSSQAHGITSGFYRPMNVHRVTLISAIRTVYLFFGILHFYAFIIIKSHLESKYRTHTTLNVKILVNPLSTLNVIFLHLEHYFLH